MVSLHTPAVCSVSHMVDLQSQLNARPGSCIAAQAAFDREIGVQAAVSAPTTMLDSLVKW